MTRHQKWKYLRQHYQLEDGSEPFRDILIKCLRFHPDNRPTLEQLLGMIKEAAGGEETPSDKDIKIVLKRKRAMADEEEVGRTYNPANVLEAEEEREEARGRLANSADNSLSVMRRVFTYV